MQLGDLLGCESYATILVRGAIALRPECRPRRTVLPLRWYDDHGWPAGHCRLTIVSALLHSPIRLGVRYQVRAGEDTALSWCNVGRARHDSGIRPVGAGGRGGCPWGGGFFWSFEPPESIWVGVAIHPSFLYFGCRVARRAGAGLLPYSFSGQLRTSRPRQI